MIAPPGYASSVSTRGLVGGLIILAACGSYGSGTAETPPSGNDGGTPTGPPLCTTGAVYVSAARGDDANEGCDSAKPKKSITSALGQAQAKSAANTEIRTCVETFREHVVLAYPASIVGGFDCTTWAPGAGKTTFEAPDDREAETVIAFGVSVLPSVRLEHLRIVGPKRNEGFTSAMRVKDGAAPQLKDDELVGGDTREGIAITLAIEGKSSPAIEDSRIMGGRARCTKDCNGAIASTVSIEGGTPKLRRTRIEGSEADVLGTGTYVGTVTLDVFRGAKATGADAFSDLEIVHGVGHVAANYATYGVRVLGQSEIDLVGVKVLPASTASTCVAGPCYAVALEATNAKVHVRGSQIAETQAQVPSGGTVSFGVVATVSGQVELASSFVEASRTLAGYAGTTIEARGSTLSGDVIVDTEGGAITVRGSLLAHRSATAPAILSVACGSVAKTTLESSVVVSAVPNVVTFAEGSSATCDTTATFATPEDAKAASNASIQFVVSNTTRTTCPDGTDACLLAVFAAKGDARLKDGVTCKIAQGGIAFTDVTTDLYGALRTMPVAMGAHEYDGSCTP
jgi:hypothetical protein